MEIKASSTFSKKTCTAMADAVYPKRKLCAILSSIIFLILFISAIILMFRAERSFAYLLITASVVIGVVAYMFIRLPSIQYSAMGNAKDATCCYTFYDNAFCGEISYSDGKMMTATTTEYEMIYKIVENSEYIFIFQNKRTMYVIEKSTVTEDELNRLRNILKQHCSLKYTELKR